MKTILLAGALALVTLSVSANNSNNSKKVNYRAAQSFQRQFGDMQNVSWNEAPDHMYRATFNDAGEVVTAFFNYEGEFVASTVNRELEQLPVKLRTNIKQKMEGAQIIDIIELQGDSEHAYYVRLRDADGQKILKGYSNGYVMVTSL